MIKNREIFIILNYFLKYPHNTWKIKLEDRNNLEKSKKFIRSFILTTGITFEVITGK